VGDAFGHNHKQKGFLYILSLRTDISQFEICFFLRLKTCGFLHSNYIFCLFFPFSPSDVHKYASRSKSKNSAPNPPAHTCASNFDLAVSLEFLQTASLREGGGPRSGGRSLRTIQDKASIVMCEISFSHFVTAQLCTPFGASRREPF